MNIYSLIVIFALINASYSRSLLGVSQDEVSGTTSAMMPVVANGYRKTRYEINAEKRKKDENAAAVNFEGAIRYSDHAPSDYLIGDPHHETVIGNGEFEESGRGIVDVQKEGLRSVSYIIHPDNLPPPDFKPIRDLPPLEEEEPSSKKGEEDVKENSTTTPSAQPVNSDNPKISTFSTPYSLIFNKKSEVDPEVASHLKNLALSIVETLHSPTQAIPDEESSNPDELPIAFALRSSSYLESSDDSEKYVTTPFVVDVDYEDNSEVILSDSDGMEGNISMYSTQPELIITDVGSDSSLDIQDNENVIFPLNGLTLDSTDYSETTPEDLSTETTITIADLQNLSDSVTKNFENLTLGNYTPRYEEKPTGAYHDVKNFLNDLANSPGFQSAFLGDLIKNFGSLDHNALKLIYSLLIQPLFERKEKTEKVENREPQYHERENELTRHSKPSYMVPSSMFHPNAYGNDLWKPLSRSPKSPPMFVVPSEPVEVITASSSPKFEVVLGSSFHHQPDSVLRPPKRLPLFQRRVGGSSDISSQPPSRVSLAYKMPPPEALAALPKGSVLIPPSQVIGKPVMPKISTVSVSSSPSKGSSEGLSGLLSKAGLSSLPAFISSLFKRKSDKPLKSTAAPVHKRPRYTSFNYQGNPQLLRPINQPLRPPPPVYKYIHRRYDNPVSPPRSRDNRHSNLEAIYGDYRPLTYSEATGYNSQMPVPKDSYNNHTLVSYNQFAGSEVDSEKDYFNERESGGENLYSQVDPSKEVIHHSSNDYDDKTDYSNFEVVSDKYENYNDNRRPSSQSVYQDSPSYLDEDDYEDLDFEPQKYDASSSHSTSADRSEYDAYEDTPSEVTPEVPDMESGASDSIPTREAVPPNDEDDASEEFSVPPEIRNFAYLHEGYSYPYKEEEVIKTYSNPTSFGATHAVSNYNNRNTDRDPESQTGEENYGEEDASLASSVKDENNHFDDDGETYIYYYDDAPEYEYDVIFDDEGVDRMSKYPYDYVEYEDDGYYSAQPPNLSQNDSLPDSGYDLSEDFSTEPAEDTNLPSELLNDPHEIINAPNVGPVDIPEGTIIPEEDFERALSEQKKYKRKFKRPRVGTSEAQNDGKEEKEKEEDGNEVSSLPALASEQDASIAHLWNNIKLIPLQAEEGDGVSEVNKDKIPSLEEQFSSFNFTEFDGHQKTGAKNDKKRYLMAYVLIGACVGLACLSIIGVFVIVRFRKTCGSRRIGGRSYLGKRSSLRELSHVAMEDEKSGHKLGSWFTGRNEQMGPGKLRSNMALPEVKDKLSKSNSTRDLLSISPASSQNSTPRHSQRSHSSSEEKKSSHSKQSVDELPSTSAAVHDQSLLGQRTSSWLQDEFAAESSPEKEGIVRSKRSKSARRVESSNASQCSYQYYGGRPREYRGGKKNAYLTSFDSEDLDRATTRTSNYPTDSEFDDNTNYEMSDSKEAEEIHDLRRSRKRRGPRSMDSEELGEELSRDLKVFQYGGGIDRRSKDNMSVGAFSSRAGGASFSRDNVQSEVFLEFDNMLSQHTLGGASQTTYSRSRPNSPDSIDKGDVPITQEQLPPPRPPKPSRLTPPSKPPPKSGRARARTPPPPSSMEAREDEREDDDPMSGSSTDEDRLI